MYLQDLKIAIRHILANKFQSILNILALGIGTWATLIITMHLGYQMSFDDFHANKSSIYSIHAKTFKDNVLISEKAGTYWAVGILVKDLPEVRAVTGFRWGVERFVSAHYDGITKSFNEQRFMAVDSAFLDVFSFKVLKGDKASSLRIPNSIVLTKSIAKKYFEDQDPIGKQLTTRVSWGAESNYVVTAVVEDPPKNSRFQFNFLTLAGDLEPFEYWADDSFSIYLFLKENININLLSSRLSQVVNKSEPITSQNKRVEFDLVRIDKHQLSDNEWLLLLIGVFIQLLSWANFVHLSLGRVVTKSKETGIRKFLGASKWQIIQQITTEGLLICILALAVSLALFFLAEPFVRKFTNNQLFTFLQGSSKTGLIFFGTFFVGSILASLYLAFISISLTKSSPIQKGYTLIGNKEIQTSKVLAISQLTISVIFTIGVFVIFQQLKFMQNTSLKMDIKKVLVIKAPKDKDGWKEKTFRLETFKSEVLKNSFVSSVTSSSTVPGLSYRHEDFFSVGNNSEKYLVYRNDIDYNYFELYNIGFLAGNGFSATNNSKNRKEVILNKSAAQLMGITEFQTAIGTELLDHESNELFTLIGIVEDYHQLSLKENIEPEAFEFNITRGHLSLKLSDSFYSNLQDNIQLLETTWKKVYPDQPFDHYFLDERFNNQYLSDVKFSKIFSTLTVLSIVIACLGLFSLSLMVVQNKLKEIGVRKVFGASSVEILSLLTRYHLYKILFSLSIGIPVAYLFMNQWLNNFAFRTSITLTSILIPSLVMLLISIAVLSFQTIKASIANPIATIRSEW